MEDWAETFAHYLHIVDATDTAIAYDLVASGTAPARNGRHATGATFERLLDAWRPINAGVNAIAEALGAAPLYPFDPTGVVVDKLAFVHQQVTAHTQRDAFYAYV